MRARETGAVAATLTSDYIDALDREWHRLRSAGTWWTGAQRVAIAAVARAARDGRAITPAELPEPAIEAAARLSTHPHIDQAWVDSLAARGVAAPAYVEILGVVSRLNAVDTFLFGIDHAEQPLPEPLDGEPSRLVVADAAINGAYVPTVGEAWAPNALSAVAAEVDAMTDLHDVLYLSMPEMGDMNIEKGLTRAQMEFVAARTSVLNDCFY